MNCEAMRRKQQKGLRVVVRVGAFVLSAFLVVVLPSWTAAQTFDNAVNSACFSLTSTPPFVCGEASSTGSPTALSRETFFDEERKVKRLVGSLGVWVAGEYEGFDKNVTTFEPGYKTDTGRATIGADYAFFDHRLVVGGAFTYARTSGNFDTGGRLTTNSYSPQLYLSIVPAPKFFIDINTGYARKDFFLSRRPLFGSSATADGDTDINEFTLGASGGYDFTFDNITVGPRLGLNYKYTAIDGYRERGNTGAELIYDKQTEYSLTSTLGLYGSVAISTAIGVLVPQVNVKYLHEFADHQRRIKFRFAAAPAAGKYRFEKDPPDRNYFELGTGISMVLPHDLQPFLNYRALVGYKDQSSHIVTAGLRVAF
ncbi:MAG: autotransporter outer membrane beta-barrel domain-containing protein [Deltaproteobacteria bacterium]|nr:autotransporter outer membrane beta-barrel domain-containing protein [Deltaproteobacteria bacterium]